MSDNLNSGEEISPSQQHEFIDKINALKPHLDIPKLITAPSIEDDPEDPCDVITNTVGKFRLDAGSNVQVRINQSVWKPAESEDDEGSNDENNVSETWQIRVPRVPEHLGGVSLRYVDIYRVEHTRMDGIEFYNPEHDEELYKKNADAKSWEKVPSELVQEFTRLNQMRDEGEIEGDEASEGKQRAFDERQEFERTIGQYGLRFTVGHFNDAMAVLDQLGPHNKID